MLTCQSIVRRRRDIVRRRLSSTIVCNSSALPRPATTSDEVLKWPAVALTQAHRHQYFQHGCLFLPSFISVDWLKRLSTVVADLIAKSKELPTDYPWYKNFVLESGHTSKSPRVVRIARPFELDEIFWDFATGPIADIAQDLLGPDVRFHHMKLNMKMSGSEETRVQWHQDIQFWPHTNYTPLTIGVYLVDVDDDMGPMDVVPLSAYDELQPLEDSNGTWTGVLSEAALQNVPLRQAIRMKGPAGTVTVHNARCVHGSPANNTSRNRPLLLHTFAAATAHPLLAGTNLLHKNSRLGMPMVRGEATNLAVFDPRPCPMAPNFEGGYSPPFFEKTRSVQCKSQHVGLTDG